MLPLHIDWIPVAAVVSVGGFLLALLRAAVWYAERRAQARTRALLERTRALLERTRTLRQEHAQAIPTRATIDDA